MDGLNTGLRAVCPDRRAGTCQRKPAPLQPPVDPTSPHLPSPPQQAPSSPLSLPQPL